ncbi:DUF1107 domain-containing protein [Shewanella surugensis]|uniref:DUF1107 domain-containing protein n=1 Tax=Shewanella surugensis TaxID=212020 RepID=A0ABT0LGB1_9GAMM|nr:DUF1107 domain-containing protein [Shewanella surugensis]MCL1126736.1 DUF1107 domain-containing protein [Shewanella surugensis]
MRVFPIYAPKLIVKHVRVFFEGSIWVKGVGRLEFSKGRMLLPRRSLPGVQQAIIELNELIESQNLEAHAS